MYTLINGVANVTLNTTYHKSLTTPNISQVKSPSFGTFVSLKGQPTPDWDFLNHLIPFHILLGVGKIQRIHHINSWVLKNTFKISEILIK